jgi:hypothetical protein
MILGEDKNKMTINAFDKRVLNYYCTGALVVIPVKILIFFQFEFLFLNCSLVLKGIF